MKTSVTNQIIPKHSLEPLTTLSEIQYFGHTMRRSDFMEKDLKLELTGGSGK